LLLLLLLLLPPAVHSAGGEVEVVLLVMIVEPGAAVVGPSARISEPAVPEVSDVDAAAAHGGDGDAARAAVLLLHRPGLDVVGKLGGRHPGANVIKLFFLRRRQRGQIS